MAVFDRITKQQLTRDFTHYGWIYGCCPVYVGDPDGECRIAMRNYIPEWPLDLMEMIYGFAIQTMLLLNPHFQPVFAIRLTGPIK